MKKSNVVQILLLEDDFMLSELIQEFLEECGYSVTVAYDGAEVFDKIYEQHFDLFLFDVKVPIKNGFDVLAELRNQHNFTPTIFITSLSSIDDLSTAYSMGCDDYLRKPFELKELQLRIQTLIKRNFTKITQDNKVQIFKDLSFDIVNFKLISNDGETILPNKEAKILKLLLSKRGNIVSNDDLFKTAWIFDEDYSEESLRTHIKMLRRLIGKDNIVNFRGQGYMLVIS